MIKGERIAAKARKIKTNKITVRRNSKAVRRIIAKFTGSAFCVIESQPAANYKIGDSLNGEIIEGKANKIGRIKVSAKEGTSRDKIQTTLLSGNAICVIDRPLRYVREALASRKKNK